MRSPLIFIKKYDKIIIENEKGDKSMNRMLSLLNEKDYQLIDTYRRNFAINENESRECDCDHDFTSIHSLLTEWADAKEQQLGKLFGDQLVLRKDISIHKSYNELKDDDNTRMYVDKLIDYTNEMRCRFRHLNKLTDSEIGALCNLVDIEILLLNEYSGQNIKIGDYRLTHGCKAMKALRQLNSILHFMSDEEFEKFRTCQSMCTNTAVLNGTLCLSIHPLDYMTMSDNDCDWSSCMSWQEAGCYRLGTIEMMNSDCVVVAYLESSHPMFINNNAEDVWNNKKWRSLYVVTPDLVTNIKGYPYSSAPLDKIITNWLYELLSSTYPEKKYEKPYTFSYPYMNGHTLRLRTGWMYNDFYHSSMHWGFASSELPEQVAIRYSGIAQCMVCGCTDDRVEMHEDSLLCCECAPREDYYVCEICGCDIHEDDAYYVEDEYIVCPSCYEHYYRDDSLTGTAHKKETMMPVLFMPQTLAKTSMEEAYHFLDIAICRVNDNSISANYFVCPEDILDWTDDCEVGTFSRMYDFWREHDAQGMSENEISDLWSTENDQSSYCMDAFISAWKAISAEYLAESYTLGLSVTGELIPAMFMYKGYLVINTAAAALRVYAQAKESWYYHDRYGFTAFCQRNLVDYGKIYNFALYHNWIHPSSISGFDF